MALVLPAITLPKKLDYTSRMTPVRAQGNEGTCVAFASVVGVKEYQDTSEYKENTLLSPRFIYALCKKFDDSPGEEGTYPRIAMKMLLKYGVCPEAFWPYLPYQTDRPKKNAAKHARKYRIKAYARLNGILEMRRNLVINGPFLAGGESF
jgi:C1A family cysteine protease